MSTWGDRLGGRPNIGIGARIAPENIPSTRTVHYNSFRFGLMFADRPGDVPEGYYPKALDIETTRNDGIKRALPIRIVEHTGHFLNNLFPHPSLDFESELVALDLPWMGIKQGATFVWYNLGTTIEDVEGVHWVYSNYGDTLVFSNGRVSYFRRIDGSQLLDVVPAMPGAGTIFTIFGRLFVGCILDNDGSFNVLGLGWNGTGDFDDWNGPDSGRELLLNDYPVADKIVAGRELSYDTAAILCRRSIWIGTRTGVASRPLDPVLRLAGIGCVFEQSAQTTEGGVTFLSDEGVRHFNGQTAEIISGPINAELLPLIYEEIESYRAVWDGGRRRYILCLPCCTFVYQFPTPEYPQGAWFKKTIAITNVVPFAAQTNDPTWDDFLDRTWDDLGNERWLDYATPESNASPDILYVSDTLYGVEDPDWDGYFPGLVMAAVVEPRPAEGQPAIDDPEGLQEVKGYLIEHRGDGGELQILARDETGAYRIMHDVTLLPSARSKTTRVEASYSIRGTGIALRILSPDVEILSIKQILQNSGEALADMITEDDEQFDETATEVLANADTLVFWR